MTARTLMAVALISFSLHAFAEDAKIGREEVAEVDTTGEEIIPEDIAEAQYLRWMNWEAQLDPSAFIENVGGACPAANPELVITVSQSKQKLFVKLNGKPLLNAKGIRVSTGMPGADTETQNGSFRVDPNAPNNPVPKRQSMFASQEAGHDVYLYYVIPFNGGQWMHAASDAGQKFLGKKHSHGCVRVDKKYMPMLFKLVQAHACATEIVVQ